MPRLGETDPKKKDKEGQGRREAPGALVIPAHREATLRLFCDARGVTLISYPVREKQGVFNNFSRRVMVSFRGYDRDIHLALLAYRRWVNYSYKILEPSYSETNY